MGLYDEADADYLGVNDLLERPPESINWNLLVSEDADREWRDLDAWATWLKVTFGLPPSRRGTRRRDLHRRPPARLRGGRPRRCAEAEGRRGRGQAVRARLSRIRLMGTAAHLHSTGFVTSSDPPQ